MANVEIRELPDWVVQSYHGMARNSGRTLEEELRRVLTELAEQRRDEFLAELDAFVESIREKYGELPDSTSEIRADVRRADDHHRREHR